MFSTFGRSHGYDSFTTALGVSLDPVFGPHFDLRRTSTRVGGPDSTDEVCIESLDRYEEVKVVVVDSYPTEWGLALTTSVVETQ